MAFPSMDVCFKCSKPFREDDDIVFSSEWDTFCHTKCCPAFNPDVKPDEECKVCDVYQKTVLEAG